MATKADQKNQARIKREAAQAAAAAAARRNRNLQFGGGAVFVAILVVLLIVVISGGDSSKKIGKNAANGGTVQGVSETNTLLAGIQQNGYALGDPKAPITVLEFLDVQCPFCKEHELDQQPTVIKQLVKTGKIVLKLQPIALPQMGEDSEAGRTVLTRMAAKNKAWNFANLFYFNQETEATGYVTDDYLTKLAKAAGGTAADAARSNDATTTAKLAAVDKLQNDLGVTGTPTFEIGLTGKPETGYKEIDLASSSNGNAQAIIDAVTKLEKSAGV